MGVVEEGAEPAQVLGRPPPPRPGAGPALFSRACYSLGADCDDDDDVTAMPATPRPAYPPPSTAEHRMDSQIPLPVPPISVLAGSASFQSHLSSLNTQQRLRPAAHHGAHALGDAAAGGKDLWLGPADALQPRSCALVLATFVREHLSLAALGSEVRRAPPRLLPLGEGAVLRLLRFLCRLLLDRALRPRFLFGRQ